MNSELSLEEIKKIEYELLMQFHKICTEQSYRYSLGGGTLLGAIRHRGFIPWDDDIDVMMPRPDYDRFIDYCINNNTPFILFSHECDENYIMLDAKLSSKDTIIVDSSLIGGKKEIGIHIDVFSIDGLGMTEKEAVSQYNRTSIKRELLNAKTWKRFFKSKTHSFYYEPLRFALYFFSRFCNAHKLIRNIERINRSIDFDSSTYAGCVSGAYRSKEIMEKAVFDEYTEIEFEGAYFKAIKKYDAYLHKHYGDYMELPPVEKRVTHHTFKAYRKGEN